MFWLIGLLAWRIGQPYSRGAGAEPEAADAEARGDARPGASAANSVAPATSAASTTRNRCRARAGEEPFSRLTLCRRPRRGGGGGRSDHAPAASLKLALP